MASLLKEWIDVIPLGWAVVGTAAAIMVFEIVVLVMAISRRRRGSAQASLKLHAIAGALVGALPVAWWIPVQAARGMTIVAYSGEVADPSMTATWLSRGLDGQIFAILLAAVATLLVALPWFAGLAITLRALRSEGRGRSVPPVALIGAGLLPLAVGVIRWGIRVNNALAVLAGVDPSMKRAFLEPPLTAARAELALSARVSTIAIAILAVLAAISVVRGRRSRAGAPSRGSARRSIGLATAAVALAAWLVFAARPAVAENDLPWPPRTNSTMFGRGGPHTPDLVGPDELDRGPVVEIFRDGRLTLDGSGTDLEDLKPKLAVLRNNFTLLHPSTTFNGTALLQVDEATPIPDLASMLTALVHGQYDRPMFLFVAKKTQIRPVFGALEPFFVTAARIKVATAEDEGGAASDWKNAVQLRLRDFADYGAFARRLVELRTASKPVLVKVERSDR